MADSSLSSPGLGSGLDVKGIVDKLMSVERQPITKLAQREAQFQAKITAFGSLKGSLSSFQGALAALKDASKFSTVKASAADSTILSASTVPGAAAGNYSVEVNKLAQAQKLSTAGQASTSAAIGNGVITFDFGAISGGAFNAATGKYTGASFTSNGNGTKSVTIDASNNSLAGIRDAINKAKIGVSASLVNDGGALPNRLVLTQESTGKDLSMKLSVSGDAALASLLGHDPAATQAMAETVTAQNAEFKIDGLSISKKSNTVTDAIQGVTLNLLKTNTGASTNLAVARDTTQIASAVNNFVKGYNDLNKTLTDLTSYDAATKKGGLLLGDSTVNNIRYNLRTTLTSALGGGTSSLSTLNDIGVEFKRDGTLSVDSVRLQNALTNTPDDIAAVFASTGKATDSLIAYSAAGSKTKAGTYAVQVTTLATQATLSGAATLSTFPVTLDNFAIKVDGVQSATITPAHANGYGTLTTAALGDFTIDASSDQFKITVDGVQSSTLAIDPADYATYNSPAMKTSLAGKLQTLINADATLVAAGKSVSVSFDSGTGRFAFQSASKGISSSVTLAMDSGETDVLGMSGGTAGARYTSGADLATDMQTAINSDTVLQAASTKVTVSYAANALSFISGRYGSKSTVEFTALGATASTAIGLTTGAPVAGVDAAGTINGTAATGDGQLLTGAVGNDADGLKITVSGGAVGVARGTVSYTEGAAFKLNKLIDTFLANDGLIKSKTDGLSSSIVNIGKQRTTLQGRTDKVEKRLLQQFYSLDKIMSDLSKTSNFLTQQLSSLNKR